MSSEISVVSLICSNLCCITSLKLVVLSVLLNKLEVRQFKNKIEVTFMNMTVELSGFGPLFK